jgi:hypothetical protein
MFMEFAVLAVSVLAGIGAYAITLAIRPTSLGYAVVAGLTIGGSLMGTLYIVKVIIETAVKQLVA